jgi:hypothetical protein
LWAVPSLASATWLNRTSTGGRIPALKSARFEEYGAAAVPWPGTAADRASADWLAISVTSLNGIYVKRDPYAAFRDIAPSARAAYSIVLYDLSKPEAQKRC